MLRPRPDGAEGVPEVLNCSSHYSGVESWDPNGVGTDVRKNEGRVNKKLLFLVLAALISGFAARIAEAERKSLWIDEMHTIDIARAPSIAGVVERVSPDFHAPLYYIAAHLLADLAPHDLRLVSGAVGLLSLIPLLLLAASVGMGALGRWAATLCFLLLPFQVRYGMELRPYAWLQLFSLVMVWAAFGRQGSTALRFIAFAAAAALGLYVHYLSCLLILAIGLVRVALRHREWLPFWKLVLAGTLGVVLFLPWVLSVESWIFKDPGVMTRNEKVAGAAPAPRPSFETRFRKLRPQIASGLARTAIPALDQLGSPWSALTKLGGIAFLLALAMAGLTLFRRGTTPPPLRRGYLSSLGSGVLACGFLIALCVAMWGRIPVQYFAVGAWIWPLMVGGLIHAAERRGRGAGIFALLAVALILMGAGHSLGAPREDLRAGCRRALELGATSPVVYTAIMRQPEHYRQTTTYAVYGAGVRAVDPLEVPPVSATAAGTQVLVLSRSTSPKDPKSSTPALWRHIEKGRRLAEIIRIDHSVRIFVYEPLPGG